MTALRLTPEQFAMSRTVGWRRALVLAVLGGAADELGRVHDVSARDVARLLGVDAALVHRDVRYLARVGAIGVVSRRGRASTITVVSAPEVKTPESAQVKTLRRSAGEDTEVGRCRPTRVSALLGADTAVGTSEDTGVGRCRPPPTGESSSGVVRACSAPPHTDASVHVLGAPSDAPPIPTPRVQKVKTTW